MMKIEVSLICIKFYQESRSMIFMTPPAICLKYHAIKKPLQEEEGKPHDTKFPKPGKGSPDTKTKQSHFPTRESPKPQEDRKGPKI